MGREASGKASPCPGASAAPAQEQERISSGCSVKAEGLELRSACGECQGSPPRGACTLLPSQILFLQGSEAQHVFAVIEGYLKESCYLPDGRSVTFRLVGPGDLVGTEALVAEEYGSTVEALTDVRVCTVPKHQLDEGVNHRADQARAFRKLQERQVQALREQLVLTNGMSAEDRVLEALRRLGRDYASGAWFKPPLNRKSLADYLGLAGATVSRAIGRLEEQGLLEVKGRAVRILQK